MKLLFVVFLLLTISPFALADEKTPSKTSSSTSPAANHIPPVDAAKLDAALAHVNLIMLAANVQLAPYNQEIERICAAYKVDRTALESLKIDPKTGVGTVAPPVAAPSAPAPPAPPAKK